MEEIAKEHKSPKPTPLVWAVGLSMVSFLATLYATIWKDLRNANILIVLEDPIIFQSYIAQAIGGSIAIPAIHVGISSLFKSKRNSTTRRRIFIGWAIVLTLLLLITTLTNK